MNSIQVVDLALTDYASAYAIQLSIHQACYRREKADTILFQENYPVITVGRGSFDEHLLASPQQLASAGIAVQPVDRGGDMSYHGPGQLVVSPILHLRDFNLTVHQYVRNLEEVVIRIMETYGIHCHRIDEYSGVWVGDEKIAATGIAVEHGITRHGISINVNPDLSHFSYIVPCGIKEKGVTSMRKLGVESIDLNRIKQDFIREFSQVFSTEIIQ